MGGMELELEVCGVLCRKYDVGEEREVRKIFDQAWKLTCARYK